MKLLQYTDKDGYVRNSWVKDGDKVPTYGIPHDPPDLTDLELTDTDRRELHNALVEAGLFTHPDVLRSGSGVTNILKRLGLGHLRRQVLTLYKLAR